MTATSPELFARLRQMWNDRDPMPADLIDSVLVAIAADSLATEYALLTMVETSRELSGVRGPAEESTTFQFSDGTMTMLLRVSPTSDGRRRVDGWLAPAFAGIVRLTQGHNDYATVVSPEGRFECEDVAAGPTRLWLEADAYSADGTPKGFTTPDFDL
ncbi:MAG: hypothetical protein ACRCSP_03510 [Rhodoglobus sp.]